MIQSDEGACKQRLMTKTNDETTPWLDFVLT